jgi:Xaa-Pro aminopeptidase
MVRFDYESRIRRYQDVLRNAGAVCGFVMRPGNVHYLSGFWGYATRAEYFEPRRLICLAVPVAGSPLLVAPKIEYEFARRAVTALPVEVRRHVEWREDGETEDSWGIVRESLAKQGVKGGRLLVERESLAGRAYGAICDAFQDFELVSGGDVVETMRMVKDTEEVALLRECGKVAVGMLEAEIAAIARGGYREFEVAMLGWDYTVRRCAEALGQTHVNSPLGEGVQLITSGPRLAMAHGSASTRLIEPTDVVMMDFCRVPFLLGYRLGMGRVVTRRRLSSEEEDIEATVQKAYRVALSYARPGATCSELDSATRAVLVGGGLAAHIVHRNGRGVGIENVELPEIKEGIPTRFEAGMVVSLEPSIYREGFASRVENTVLITASGPEVLTPAPDALRRLGG